MPSVKQWKAKIAKAQRRVSDAATLKDRIEANRERERLKREFAAEWATLGEGSGGMLLADHPDYDSGYMRRKNKGKKKKSVRGTAKGSRFSRFKRTRLKHMAAQTPASHARHLKKRARKAGLSVGTRRKNSSAARRKSTAALRGRMFVRMRPDAAGWMGVGLGYNKAYDDAIKSIAGKVVEVDTKHLFDDQYNLKDYPVRVFDQQIVEVINDVRRGRGKSGWSGRMGPMKGPEGRRVAAEALREWETSKYRRPEDPASIASMRPLRTHKSFSPGRGPWTNHGTVTKIFKNKTVLTSKKRRFPRGGPVVGGIGSSMFDRPFIGAKVFEDPEGRIYYLDGSAEMLRYAHAHRSKLNTR